MDCFTGGNGANRDELKNLVSSVVKKIIFEHFEYIESEWDEFQEKK